jgi:hypothetical protein
MPKERIKEGLALIFEGIATLKGAFPNRAFTIDGRLVGDIGEVIAALEYDVILHDTILPGHDGVTSDGRSVQIKATFQKHLTFRTTPDLYLGFKLFHDGTYREIYNGPGELIYNKYAHRKGIGASLLSFPISDLEALSKEIEDSRRVPKRAA